MTAQVAERYQPLRANSETSPHPVPRVPMPTLLWVFLWLGSISIGGRASSFFMDEFVKRRHWLKREDWVEAHLLGRVLPGPSSVGDGMFMAHMLGGPLAAGLALTLFVVPGTVLSIGLSYLVFDATLPTWAGGAIRGLSASALGFFAYLALRNVPITRKTRLGPIVAVAAFVSQALLSLDLFITMAAVGAVSLSVNLPDGTAKEPAHE